MIDLAYALVGDIEDALTDDLCEVRHVGVTYGSPAAPVGEECREIWVWLARVEDDNQFDTSCQAKTRLTYAVRIYSCYSGEIPLSETHHEAAAECIIGLVDAIWCSLVRNRDQGLLMGLDHCDEATLLPFVADSPQGGAISFTGGVTVDYSCPIS